MSAGERDIPTLRAHVFSGVPLPFCGVMSKSEGRDLRDGEDLSLKSFFIYIDSKEASLFPF